MKIAEFLNRCGFNNHGFKSYFPGRFKNYCINLFCLKVLLNLSHPCIPLFYILHIICPEWIDSNRVLLFCLCSGTGDLCLGDIAGKCFDVGWVGRVCAVGREQVG